MISELISLAIEAQHLSSSRHLDAPSKTKSPISIISVLFNKCSTGFPWFKNNPRLLQGEFCTDCIEVNGKPRFKLSECFYYNFIFKMYLFICTKSWTAGTVTSISRASLSKCDLDSPADQGFDSVPRSNFCPGRFFPLLQWGVNSWGQWLAALALLVVACQGEHWISQSKSRAFTLRGAQCL